MARGTSGSCNALRASGHERILEALVNGHVEDPHLAAATKKEAELLEKFRAAQPAAPTPVGKRVAE